MIQFETMGHCDRLEGGNAEWKTITELEHAGYTPVAYSHYNRQLVRIEALKFPHIDKWVDNLQCWGCNKRKLYPYIFASLQRWWAADYVPGMLEVDAVCAELSSRRSA